MRFSVVGIAFALTLTNAAVLPRTATIGKVEDYPTETSPDTDATPSPCLLPSNNTRDNPVFHPNNTVYTTPFYLPNDTISLNPVLPSRNTTRFVPTYLPGNKTHNESTITTGRYKGTVVPRARVGRGKVMPRAKGGDIDIVGMAVELTDFIVASIKSMSNFKKMRETSIRGMTQKMLTDELNPDWRTWPAAICYNNGYKLADPANIRGKSSFRISAGFLSATYDCFWMGVGNSFWSEGDGGSLNLHITSKSGICRFDNRSDMYC